MVLLWHFVKEEKIKIFLQGSAELGLDIVLSFYV